MNTGLNEYTGKVIELLPKLKAIVQFQLNNKAERALLWYNKLKVNGHSLPEGDCINDYLSIGSSLTFLCHKLDENGVDRCGWYITCAWRQDLQDHTISFSSNKITRGLHNITGTIVELAKRQGILMFVDNQGNEQNVRFLASKMFLFGKRLSSKMNLEQVAGIEEGKQLFFDAVPCEQTNEKQCRWFATVVWKGKKPTMDYENSTYEVMTSKSWLSQIKQISLNPRGLYLCGEGQIMKILNEEWGIALGAVKVNCWQSILIHRSACYLFKMSLANEDLTEIFKEGDKIRFIAAAAPKHMIVKWVAAQVRVFVDPSINVLFDD